MCKDQPDRYQAFLEWHKGAPELRYGQAFCVYFRVWPPRLFNTVNQEEADRIVRSVNEDYQWKLNL